MSKKVSINPACLLDFLCLTPLPAGTEFGIGSTPGIGTVTVAQVGVMIAPCICVDLSG